MKDTSGVLAQYLYSFVISLNHLSYGFTVSCVYHRSIMNDGEGLDGCWDSYPGAKGFPQLLYYLDK